MTGPQYMAGRRVLLLVKARGLPAAEVYHNPSNQIVSESWGVDHLDEEAVRDRIKRLRDVYRYGYCSDKRLTLVETRDPPSRNGEQDRRGGVPLFEAVLRGTSTQCLHDGWKEEPLQYLHCRAEQWDGAVGAALGSWLSCLQYRDYGGVLSNCRNVNSGNRETEDLRQVDQAVLTKMAKVEHGEPVRHLGGGRARIPSCCCDVSLVEPPVRRVHTMVVVEVSHEPSECLIVLGRTDSKLPVGGLYNRLRAGVDFSFKGDWDIWWGTRPLSAQFA